MEICHLQWNTAHRTSTSRTRHRGTAAKGDAWLYPAWFVATELTRPKSSWLLCLDFGVFCRRKCTELNSRISMNWSANFFGNGQNWIT